MIIRKHNSTPSCRSLKLKLRGLFKTLLKASVAAAALLCLLLVLLPDVKVYSANLDQTQNEQAQQDALNNQTNTAENQLPPRQETALDNNAMTDVINSVLNGDTPQTLEILMFLTLLTLAPTILIMMTSFTRIVIVLSLLKNAMGLQQTPPSQVLAGMALFLTLFIMMPVINEVQETAYQPYMKREINAEQALKVASVPMKSFMLHNTTPDDMEFFLQLADKPMPDDPAKNLGLEIVVPAFVTSELKQAFTIGFLLYIPFLVVDIVVSSTLMSLGMVMLPPAMVAMPFKIMLFIVADGWKQLFGTLVRGFK